MLSESQEYFVWPANAGIGDQEFGKGGIMTENSLHQETDLLKSTLKTARRITLSEQINANLWMFKDLGLEIDDLERMAQAGQIELEDLLLLSTNNTFAPKNNLKRTVPGRKNSTADIADFGYIQRYPDFKLPWKQVLKRWRKCYPSDKRVKNEETIREAVRRHYGDKEGKGY